MLELFVAASLDALRKGERLPARALIVLTRVYAATGDADLAEAIGAALASAFVTGDDLLLIDQADRLCLFGEASRLSDDPRLGEAATASAVALQRALDVYARASYADRAAAVHAILSASAVLDAQRFVPDTIDELERLVAASYSPGEGLAGRSADESVAVALALLAALDVTGRLAYPMLAEEVMRAVVDDLADAAVTSRCDAARVLGRLARLHEDPGYRATAVLAPGADYGRDAAALLEAIDARSLGPRDMAALALALTEQPDRS